MRALLPLLILGQVATVHAQQYSVATFASPDGQPLNVKGIGDNGQVVGYTGTIPHSPTSRGTRGFTWSQGSGFTQMGLPIGGYPVGSDVLARSINVGGLVAGTIVSPTGGLSRAFRWLPTTGYELLPLTAQATSSDATGITNAGVVLGSMQVSSSTHAARWDIASVEDVHGLIPNATSSYANAQNATGTFVGYAAIPGGPSGSRPAIAYGPAGFRNLSAEASISLTDAAVAINSVGDIVGTDAATGEVNSFLWRSNTTIQRLWLGYNGPKVWVTGINDFRETVGYFAASGTTEYHAALFNYDAGTTVDLATLAPEMLGWSRARALGINSLGQVVGDYVDQNLVRGFVLTPVPEPQSILALGGILLTLLRRHQKR